MNEKIIELLKTATDNVLGVPIVNHKKFAELIVQECAKAAYKYTDDSKNYEHYDDVGWDCLPGDLKSHIKKRFGVEE